MKPFKFFLLWIIVTVVMSVTWSIGFLVGNGITGSIPPEPENASSTASSFLLVCLINSLLLCVLVWSTKAYAGVSKIIALVSYVFMIQFLLTQLETFFFSKSIGIRNDQILSIIVAGLVMSVMTVTSCILIFNKMNRHDAKTPFQLGMLSVKGDTIVAFLLLSFVVYPVVYLFFGYYIAWQSESLRMFYTGSAELNSFFAQSTGAFADGIYFFQMFRGAIWVIISIPVVLMLQQNKIFPLVLFALVSSLMPSTLLFIPNPYIPADIAMTHFYETSVSNFLWGMAIAFVVRGLLKR